MVDSSPAQTKAVDDAIKAAQSLPDLISKAKQVDPSLSDALEGKALIASKTPWGTLLAAGIAYLASKYALGWDQTVCELLAGAGVLLGSYLMRYISANRITGLFSKASTGPAISTRTLSGLAILLALSTAACSSQAPISANPVQDVISAPNALPELKPLQTTIVQGLQDADANLHQAVDIGALDANDPAPGCFDSVLADLGIGPNAPAAAKSFTPKVSDLISAGSVLYIRARQAEKLAQSGGPSFSIPCKALIGQFVIDAGRVAGKAGMSALPGSGLLRVIGLP